MVLLSIMLMQTHTTTPMHLSHSLPFSLSLPLPSPPHRTPATRDSQQWCGLGLGVVTESECAQRRLPLGVQGLRAVQRWVGASLTHSLAHSLIHSNTHSHFPDCAHTTCTWRPSGLNLPPQPSSDLRHQSCPVLPTSTATTRSCFTATKR